MTKEHTPTPWKIIDYVNAISEPSVRIEGANGDTVADDEPYYPQPITPENAAHIVKCVNMHDELVEALKKCGMLLEHGGFDLEFIDSALKKAGAL